MALRHGLPGLFSKSIFPRVVKISIARAGKTIGEYSLEELKVEISGGVISPNDFAWHAALPAWMTVAEVFAGLGEQVPKIQPAKEQKPVYPDWRLDPATQRQVDYLRSFGIEPKTGLTKGEASDLIDKAQNDPVAVARQEKFRATEYERKREEEVKFPSYYLRRLIRGARDEVEDCKRRKAETKSDLAPLRRRLAAAEKKQERDLLNDALVDEIQAIKDEIAEAEPTLGDYPSELQDAQEELKNNLSLRSNFWKSTFSPMGAVMVDSSDLIDYADTIDRMHDQLWTLLQDSDQHTNLRHSRSTGQGLARLGQERTACVLRDAKDVFPRCVEEKSSPTDKPTKCRQR